MFYFVLKNILRELRDRFRFVLDRSTKRAYLVDCIYRTDRLKMTSFGVTRAT